jgi:ElaB/YqjD/DUF883 family membrane-anchored ribosome-binding protein
MDKINTSSENIAEALKLLDDAAEMKKDELKSLIANKYLHLKSMIMETETSFAKTLTDAKNQALNAVIHAKEIGTEKSIELARGLDKNVHSNPWPYIGGTAVIGVLLGFMLGRGKK